MSLSADRSFKMKMRDVENAFKYRRIPYPKRSVELIALVAISCTFFLFMHTNKLNSRLKEMEIKLQPSEFSALGLTGNHISSRDSEKPDDVNTLHGTYQYLKSTGQLTSLNTDALNNTPRAEIDVLFFARSTKVGSEALIELIDHLQRENAFTIDRTGLYATVKRQIGRREQERIADHIIQLRSASIYIEHVPWIDFHEFNLPKPIFINMVRDPVERVVSWYYYIRSAYRNAIFYSNYPDAPLYKAAWYKKSFNECVRSRDPECQFLPQTLREATDDFRRQSLFFCGHRFDCLPFNSPLAVQIAKRRVETEYAVVGSWEATNITLTVLENYIPRYFHHARRIYQKHKASLQNRNRNKLRPHIDPDVRAILRKNFTYEYEFYNFCKQRLFRQYLALHPDKRN